MRNVNYFKFPSHLPSYIYTHSTLNIQTLCVHKTTSCIVQFHSSIIPPFTPSQFIYDDDDVHRMLCILHFWASRQKGTKTSLFVCIYRYMCVFIYACVVYVIITNQTSINILELCQELCSPFYVSHTIFVFGKTLHFSSLLYTESWKPSTTQHTSISPFLNLIYNVRKFVHYILLVYLCGLRSIKSLTKILFLGEGSLSFAVAFFSFRSFHLVGNSFLNLIWILSGKLMFKLSFVFVCNVSNKES